MFCTSISPSSFPKSSHSFNFLTTKIWLWHSKSKAQREKEEKQREEELAAQAQKEAEVLAGKDKNTLEPPSDPSFVRYLEEVHEKVLPLSTTVEQITVLAR